MRVREVEKISPRLLKKLVSLDKGAFGPGATNEWTLPVFAKYGKVFILEEKSQPFGLAYLVKDWNSPACCFLHGFSVACDRRGQGLGRFFMEQILVRLKEQGMEKIKLTVSPQNELALKLYGRFGFCEIEYSKNEYGLGEDRLVLELKLTEREIGGKF